MRLRALLLAIARSYFRDKVTLFFTFAFPLVFLVVFGLLYGHQSVGSGSGIDYTAPGVMSWGVANAALFGVAYSLIRWRNSEVLRLIRMTPTPLPVVLTARFLMSIAVALVQAVLFIGVAMLPVFGLHVSAEAVMAVPVLLAGVAAFFAIGLLIGMFATSPEAIAAISNCIILPMAFLSGTFYPIALSPRWMQIASLLLPLRYLVDGTGRLISGSAGASYALIPCAALLGFTAVFAGLALKFFRWDGVA